METHLITDPSVMVLANLRGCSLRVWRDKEMPKNIAGLNLYNLKEISKKLDVTTSTLRAYIRQGKIKARKVAGKWLVSDEALRQYFNRRESGNGKKKKGKG
jgi:excisionase family DNA binding protein